MLAGPADHISAQRCVERCSTDWRPGRNHSAEPDTRWPDHASWLISPASSQHVAGSRRWHHWGSPAKGMWAPSRASEESERILMSA